MRSHLSLVQQIVGILVFILLVVFITGYSMMHTIEYANLDHIYAQTQELVSATIGSTEDDIAGVQEVLYNIIVSDTVQSACSDYLRYLDEGNRAASRISLDAIVNHIQQLIQPAGLVSCANLLCGDGTVRVIASRGYHRMPDDLAAQVDQAARAAQGAPVCIAAGEKDTFILARALREKQGLSMRHIAVVALYVDMRQIGETLTSRHEGVYILRQEEAGLCFVLGEGADSVDPGELAGLEMGERGYVLQDVGQVRYFVTRFIRSGQTFSYTVLLPYDEAFAQVERSFAHYVRIYICCCLAVILLAICLMRFATRDFSRLMTYLRGVSDSSFRNTELPESLHLTSRDTADLYAAFNAMARQVNELIYDNYHKQLLLKETQLASLQAQMNPHFLYNTLNSIYWMAKQSGDNRIAEMSDSLSRLLREAVNVSETLIEIDRELDIVFHYVRIQRQRYAGRMKLSFDVSEECNNLMIPKFTIQPLLGNAINYGVDKMLEPCAIRVRIFRKGDDCICQVTNQGPPPEDNLMDKLRKGEVTPHGTGVGLLNIDQRIRSVFGDAYGVRIERDEQAQETIAQARFRAMTAAELEAEHHG
ncbi:MAG: sensor histidine kinase [Aristaeellaceae bacterium]